MSIFCRLGRSSKESVRVRWFLVTCYFLWWEVVIPTPNHQAGGPPLVVCPWLLIKYIRSYPPFLEAVPPSATRGRAMLWGQGPNKQRIVNIKMTNLIILFSNCFACRHFRIQVRQKQWLQFGSIPKRCSRGGFSITTSKQTPHVLSLERATAKDSSISCSCCLMHSCNSKSTS
jgi:hypothetical protein